MTILDRPTLHPVQHNWSNYHLQNLPSLDGTFLSHKTPETSLHFIHPAPIWSVTSSSISPLPWITGPDTWNLLSWGWLVIKPHAHVCFISHVIELALARSLLWVPTVVSCFSKMIYYITCESVPIVTSVMPWILQLFRVCIIATALSSILVAFLISWAWAYIRSPLLSLNSDSTSYWCGTDEVDACLQSLVWQEDTTKTQR